MRSERIVSHWGIEQRYFIVLLKASELSLYIYGVRSSGHPTGQKVKPNMADMEALSYVGSSPPAPFLLYT